MSLAMDYTTLGGGAAMIAIVGYFLRKVDSKVDDNASVVAGLRQSISEMRNGIRDDITVIFNTICHERQDACNKLQDIKFTSSNAGHAQVCSKFAQLNTDRKDNWREQKEWNRRMEDLVLRKYNGIYPPPLDRKDRE